MKEGRPGIDYIGITTPFYCNDGEGNFLFHKRSKECRDEVGRWDMGSGQLEFGETPEGNVLKEIREEYGCEGIIQEGLPAFSIIREMNGIKTHWLSLAFFVKVDPSEAKNNEPHKFEEVQWFDLDNLPYPLHSGLQQQMRAYSARFEKYRK